MSPISALNRPGGFGRVVVVAGHLTDTRDRVPPRFPEDQVDRVSREVGAHLDECGLGRGDLLICGGARGADLVGALEGLARDVTVWVLLSRPADEFVAASVEGADPVWVDRFWWVLLRSPSWPLSCVGEYAGRDDVYAATNEWMLDTAVRQGEGAAPTVVAVWDGVANDTSGGTSHMVTTARERGLHPRIVDPLVPSDPRAAR